MPLTIKEKQIFEAELRKIETQQQEQVMEIVTSWMKEGMQKGQLSLVVRQLRKRLGPLEPETEARLGELTVEQLEELAEALLDFTAPSDLTAWLESHGKSSGK